MINSVFAWLANRLDITMDCTSIKVRDTVSTWHADSGNAGLSLMVLGHLGGGEFQVATSPPHKVAGAGICFSGAERHRSIPFQGERWSLIAPCHRAHGQVSDRQRLPCNELAFPWAEQRPRNARLQAKSSSTFAPCPEPRSATPCAQRGSLAPDPMTHRYASVAIGTVSCA